MINRRLIVPLTLAAVLVTAAQAHAQGAFPAPLPGGAVQPNDAAFPPVNGSVKRNDPAFPPVNGSVRRSDPAFPPVNGSAPAASIGGPAAFPSAGAAPIAGGSGGFSPVPQQQAGPPGGPDCMKNFLPLRQEAEKRGNLIKAASDRHAPPDEACKLIGQFSQAETKMIKYVQLNRQKCGIPEQINEQLKAGHKNTETMLKKVCAVAQQAQQRAPAGPTLSDVLGSSAGVPEATPSKRNGGSTFDTLSGNVLAR